MGYMGFGMRKSDRERKPKEAFKKAKELYGNGLKHFPKTAAPAENVSTDFAELARLRSQHEKSTNLSASIIKIVCAIGMLILLALLLHGMINGVGYKKAYDQSIHKQAGF